MKLKKNRLEVVSYLNSLNFESKLLLAWPAKYIKQVRFVILLIATIVLLGAVSYFALPRRLNPEIKIPIVTIVTTLPGGTPEDIESLITTPLEDKLSNIKGTDTMNSVTSENVSVISIQFTSNTDSDKARNDVEKAVGEVRDLPDDASAPQIKIVDFDDQPFWSFIIYSKGDEASLIEFSKKLKKAISDIPKVDRVTTSGLSEEFIQVKFDPSKLSSLKLDPFTLSQVIKGQTLAYPAGGVKTDTSSYSLAIDSQIGSVSELRSLPINVSGQTVKLGDIADVVLKNRIDEPISLIVDKNSSPTKSISFFVYKSASANIDASATETKKVVDKMLAVENGKYLLKSTQNNADEITKQFSDLFGEFRSTLILVFGLLFVFLGMRQALISSLTIPLTFLSTFAIIHALGLTLNFLTMFALLIALGLLIDDTIVVVAAMTRYYATGKFTPYEVAVLVWKDFIVPLWSTTITTIWAFVPLLLSTGIIGEFIKTIPIVVTATMISSTSIATFITIPLMMVFLDLQVPYRVKKFFKYTLIASVFVILALVLPKSKLFILTYLFSLIVIYFGFMSRELLQDFFKSKIINLQKYYQPIFAKLNKYSDEGIFSIEGIAQKYMVLIRKILRSAQFRKQTLLAILAFVIVAYSLLGFGLVKSEFFPKTDENLLFVSLVMPVGTSTSQMNSLSTGFLNRLKKVEFADFVTADVGSTFDGQQGRSRKNNSILATISLVDKSKRNMTSQEIAEKLRDELASYPTGKIVVQELSGGPPAGADVQINLLGPNLQTLGRVADDFEGYLKKQTGILNPSRSIESGTGKLVFVPDREKLASNNISLATIGIWLRAYATGFELDKIKIGDEEIAIEWNFYDKLSLSQIESLAIPTRDGYLPLSALGKIELKNNPTQITRENGIPTISVFASAGKGFNVNSLNANFVNFAKSYDFPEGYTFKTGGVNEENAKSVQSILQAMMLSGLLILITMVIEFGSFRQAFLACLIIPVSIAGVFYVFGLTGIPLSFPALIGILALFGIVVTHAIVVIEKINDNRKEGLSLEDSIVDAAGNRLEPVVLTSLATIFGLIPITLSDPLWQGLGGAIIAGLLFSGAIKLFLVPVLYYNFYKDSSNDTSKRHDNNK